LPHKPFFSWSALYFIFEFDYILASFQIFHCFSHLFFLLYITLDIFHHLIKFTFK
jgi:hypothetical protein